LTRRRELDERRFNLNEVHSIMNSMKTLAYRETHKLQQVIKAQKAVVDNINAIATDFIHFFPETLPPERKTTNVFLLIGSERGFCGNFNESILQDIKSRMAEDQENNPILVTVGYKLYTTVKTDYPVFENIDGANTVEEVESVLMRIIDTLYKLQTNHPVISLFAIYQTREQPDIKKTNNSAIRVRQLLPAFQQHNKNKPPDFSLAPAVNLSPSDFMMELTDHYLFATLHEILYSSLLTENHQRVQHLDGALQHLEEKNNELRSQSNRLRQEEIIEEIEVILLSSKSLM